MNELPGVSEASLADPVDMPYVEGYPNKLGALLMSSHHEFLHAGQIGILRRLRSNLGGELDPSGIRVPLRSLDIEVLPFFSHDFLCVRMHISLSTPGIIPSAVEVFKSFRYPMFCNHRRTAVW